MEYCGTDRHEYELVPAIENIGHTRTKAGSRQTNGICERFNKTPLNESYHVAFRCKIYTTLEELQADLDEWMREYNEDQPHPGRWCFGKTPMQTLAGQPADCQGEDAGGSRHLPLRCGS